MIIFLILLIPILIAADQIVKYWAVESLMPVGSMDFIKFGDTKIFDLTYLENTGAIFGSMSGQRWFLIGFTSIVIAAAVIGMFIAHKKNAKFLSFIIALFIAGGIGNLIDRIRFGYVVDMFELKLFRFAIFNVADIYVTVACILAIIYVLFIEPKKAKAEKNE